MSSLELKIPPALLVLLTATMMYLVSVATGGTWIESVSLRVLALVLGLAGTIVAVTGVVQFKKAKTTVNPVAPTLSSSLVTGGIYRLSRNPMYLGFLLMLTAWALVLANPYAVMFLPLFVAYMNRFQIAPEERALTGRFGRHFTAYMSRVRRWL